MKKMLQVQVSHNLLWSMAGPSAPYLEFVLYGFNYCFCTDHFNPLTPAHSQTLVDKNFLTYDSMGRILKCDHSLVSC